ncbi:MAG: hypothetical protein KGN16_20400 [Burkholderiales bacterium]|nr:hypothetical protein [Burkholderiales bacterium]
MIPTMGARCARWLWLLIAMLLSAGTVAAQTLDEIESLSRDGTPVLRIRFNASVHFLQLAPAGAADLYTLRFELIAADDLVQRQTADEFRRLPAAGDLPEVGIAYTPDATSRTRTLTIKLARPLNLQARQGPNSRSIDLLVLPPKIEQPGPHFALVLQTVPQAEADRIKPVPPELGELEVHVRPVTAGGVASLELTAGYFTSQRAAAAALALALPRFPQARIVDLSRAEPALPETRSCLSTEPAADAALEAKAGELMAQARQALDAKEAEPALAALDQLLKLPPNSRSLAAQELIGNAWELAGNPRRARVEYELYLKLCPDEAGQARVRARLAAIGPETGGAVAAAKPWSGSLAQYYYGGKARTKSLVSIATGIDQATLSLTNESAIVTSLDLSGRIAGENSETRVVARGSGSTNLLGSGHSTNSISAVYAEHRRLGSGPLAGLAVRVGRQSPISGGLLGLFDGISLAYPVSSGVKVDVMGGVPASPLVSAPNETLFAAVVEADSFAEHWGGNFYLLDQTTQGITNRRALGSELRYAGDRWSLDGLLDYDTVFNMLNALSVHGSFQVAPQTTLTMLFDGRRAPDLELTNALISSGAASIKTLLQTQTLDEVRAAALATSAIARQFMVSIARPLDSHWQASTDLRYSAVGALPAVGDFAATPATGGQYGWTGQLTGTNLYSKRDISNFNVSVMTTPLFKGLQLSVNNLSVLPGHPDLTLEPSLRLYTQRDNQSTKLLRVGPGLRLSYRASGRASLLGEMLYEVSRTDGPTNHAHSDTAFFYVGYRYELF